MPRVIQGPNMTLAECRARRGASAGLRRVQVLEPFTPHSLFIPVLVEHLQWRSPFGHLVPHWHTQLSQSLHISQLRASCGTWSDLLNVSESLSSSVQCKSGNRVVMIECEKCGKGVAPSWHVVSAVEVTPAVITKV